MLRRIGFFLMIFFGLCWLYFAYLVLAEEVWPRVQETGWSLSGGTMILNRVWEGNELYVLVALYAGIGLGLVAGGVFAWKRSRKAQPTG